MSNAEKSNLNHGSFTDHHDFHHFSPKFTNRRFNYQCLLRCYYNILQYLPLLFCPQSWCTTTLATGCNLGATWRLLGINGVLETGWWVWGIMSPRNIVKPKPQFSHKMLEHSSRHALTVFVLHPPNLVLIASAWLLTLRWWRSRC